MGDRCGKRSTEEEEEKEGGVSLHGGSGSSRFSRTMVVPKTNTPARTEEQHLLTAYRLQQNIRVAMKQRLVQGQSSSSSSNNDVETGSAPVSENDENWARYFEEDPAKATESGYTKVHYDAYLQKKKKKQASSRLPRTVVAPVTSQQQLQPPPQPPRPSDAHL